MTHEAHEQDDETAGAPEERSETPPVAGEAEGRAAESSGEPEAAGAEREAETDEPRPDPGPPEADREDALAEARREARENLERALRAQAELENVRRRAARDVEKAHKSALKPFVEALLPVRDSLELGLATSSGNGSDAAGIVEGVELTLQQLGQVMEKFGIKAVDPAGAPFDPEFHQAITMQESDTAESGTVLAVVQKGYLLNERLVRPAMVIVAK